MKRDIASGDNMDVASIAEEGFKMLNEEEKAASGV
jgi:20S proteasome alpha/beta subunit